MKKREKRYRLQKKRARERREEWRGERKFARERRRKWRGRGKTGSEIESGNGRGNPIVYEGGDEEEREC